MNNKFQIIFLDEALEFLESLDLKAREKIYYNADKTKLGLDPKIFKKLTDEIWELRTLYRGKQYRFFAFWDKTDKTETLVISTHGIVKKVSKIPKREIDKTMQIRTEYFDQKD